MALSRLFPNNITPNGTDVELGFRNDDKEIKRILDLIDGVGSISLAGSKRQCVLYGSVDTVGQPNFLTATGLNVSIDGGTKPIILSFANGFSTNLGTIDIIDDISTSISNAWTLPANGTYYLYIDKDINTGILNFGYTATPDQYLKAAPTSPVLDQNYFNLTEMKMYRWNGSAWEQKLRIFVGSVTTGTDAGTISPYRLSSRAADDGIRPGWIVESACADLDDGYLWCNGAAVSRALYPTLFQRIGTRFGAGDGSTTFNLPDKRGRVGVGLNASDTDFATLGKTGGEKTHVLSVGELAAHGHITDMQGNHRHPLARMPNDATNELGARSGSGQGNWHEEGCGYAGNHQHNVLNTGNNQPHNNLQPYLTINYIIKF